MDVKKLSGIESLTPSNSVGGVTGTTGSVGQQGRNQNVGGPSFKETLERLKTPGALPQQPTTAPIAKPMDGLKFSNHAIERMQSRGISYSPEDITRLNEALTKAKAKGAKDSLILMDDSALIVSVKNNTVVTVMDKMALKENVFTNIDSTIVM